MTIRTHYEIVCDQCETEHLFDHVDGWQDFMQQMRDEGWRSRKVGEDWRHYCPDCRY